MRLVVAMAVAGFLASCSQEDDPKAVPEEKTVPTEREEAILTDWSVEDGGEVVVVPRRADGADFMIHNRGPAGVRVVVEVEGASELFTDLTLDAENTVVCGVPAAGLLKVLGSHGAAKGSVAALP